MNGPETPATEERLATLDRRVEHLEFLLGLAVEEKLHKLRQRTGVDEVDAAILRSTSDWAAAAEIKAKANALTGAAKGTVANHFKALVDLGALETRGNTNSREYRNTFLLG